MIDPTSSTSSTTATSGTTGTTKKDNSVLGKDDFLKLMVAQLQHQDPSNPTDSSQYMSQMAQFTTLEQITNLNDTASAGASNEYDAQAVQLIGKQVTYANDQGAATNGTVDSVTFTSSGPTLTIDGQTGILPATVLKVA